MIASSSRRLRRPGAVFALVLLLGAAPAAAGARTYHPAATTVQSVAYHLTLVMIGAASSDVEGQLSGSLDSRGVLTATLTTTDGMTGTVGGMLSAATGVSLTVGLRGMAVALSGRTGSTGTGSGQAATAAGATGAWLLVPEPVSHTYTFDARILIGRYRGQNLGGQLVIAVQKGPAGRFDGTLTTDQGAALVATGSLVYGNMQLAITVPGMGRILGDAPLTQSQSQTLLGAAYNLYKGTFAGPGTGDRGIWTAAQEG